MPHTAWIFEDLLHHNCLCRNHWRRDAVLGEDGSRSRNVTLLANLALIRNALLRVLAPELEHQSLPVLLERLHSHPGRGLALLARS